MVDTFEPAQGMGNPRSQTTKPLTSTIIIMEELQKHFQIYSSKHVSQLLTRSVNHPRVISRRRRQNTSPTISRETHVTPTLVLFL